MSKTNPIPVFFLVLMLTLGLVFFLHLAILKSMGLVPFGNLLVLSYLLNALMAFGIFVGLYLLRTKLSNSIGFLFMAGSFLKFLVFFAVFYPSYKADGAIDKWEFAAFFVPYAISLVLETIFTAGMLQKMK